MRKRMVTRTVKEQVVKYHVYNLKTKKVEEKETKITPPKKNPGQIVKSIEKTLDENHKFLEIMSQKINENRYGVLEEDFLKFAMLMVDEQDSDEKGGEE